MQVWRSITVIYYISHKHSCISFLLHTTFNITTNSISTLRQTHLSKMESAKAAVKDFLSHHGKHDTEVTSSTSPAVTNETVTRTNDNRVTTAVDKEVHQDHHHTTVQPVHDRQVKSEHHHHNVVPVEQRSYEHDNADNVKSKLASEAARFKDSTRTVDGGSTTTAAPTVGGEHVHHVS